MTRGSRFDVNICAFPDFPQDRREDRRLLGAFMPRFPPNNDHIADMAVGQFGATIWLVNPNNSFGQPEPERRALLPLPFLIITLTAVTLKP
jgi:hypothetical protein